jgi:hypothetical protein
LNAATALHITCAPICRTVVVKLATEHNHETVFFESLIPSLKQSVTSTSLDSAFAADYVGAFRVSLDSASANNSFSMRDGYTVLHHECWINELCDIDQSL